MSQYAVTARRSKRPRSPSSLSDLDRYPINMPSDDIDVARRKSRITRPTPEIDAKMYYGYLALGQYLARCFDPMVPIREVLIYANAFILGSESEDEEDINDEPTQKYNIRAWNEIISIFPEVRDDLFQLSLDEFKARIQAIKSGISGARSTDANRLKTYTADYVPLDPMHEKVVLRNGRSKMERGFNHPILGRLLLPVDLLGDYDENRDEVINRIESGRYPVTALQFPTFLYKEGSYDPNDLLNGLFRGHFLIRCCISIFLGPQNALSAPGQVVVSRSCVANRLNVTRVTPQIIAYICMQARFTLATDGSWGYRNGGFDYGLFHRKIIDLFCSENTSYDNVWATATLEWWNKQVFGNKDGNPTLITTNSNDEEDNNFFARVEAQVAKRTARMGTSTSEPTRLETPRLTPSTPLPTSPMPPSNAPSPVTPQHEDSDDEIGRHPKHGRTRNSRTNDTSSPVSQQKERGHGKSGKGKARRR